VLDSGLAVLSLAAGPVLGAFLTGVLTRRVGAFAMLIGMAVGCAVMGWVWWNEAVGWTWFAFIGAATTGLAALASSLAVREPAHA
jgi:Na+/proline symporter